MKPTIVMITGPQEGTSHEVGPEPFTIGRHSSNQLQIRHLSASRKHAAIAKDAGNYYLKDSGSRHGTFVNGISIRSHLLKHGDMIGIGDVRLLFLLRADATKGSSVTLQANDSFAETSAQIKAGESLFLHPKKVQAVLPETAAMARALNALLEISNAVHTAPGMDALCDRLANAVFNTFPCQRTVLGMLKEGTYEFTQFHTRERDANAAGALSQTVTDRVLKEGVALLCNDVMGDAAFDEAASLHAARIRSALCAPLISGTRTLGVLYLDTTDTKSRFNEDHLQLLAAISAVGAVALEKAMRMDWLERENQRLRAVAIEHDLVGESPAMRRVLSIIERVAPTNATVLIRGESGTGKELAARALHQNSPRANKIFVAINCATLSETLLESELFGHEKGAFTGAVSRKIGKLEMAHLGTVFLDEVGEMPIATQAKLLRVLQEREFERVGGSRPIHIDVRLIAASNRDLEQAIDQGRFRQDLFYRLNVISLTMPPLRDRRDDIPLLASYFSSKHCRQLKRPVMSLSPEARDRLMQYDWPGNVRELANAVERAAVMGQTDQILLEDLPESVLERPGSPLKGHGYHQALNELKKQLILEAVKNTQGNITQAAKRLGLHPNYLHRLIANLELKEDLKK